MESGKWELVGPSKKPTSNASATTSNNVNAPRGLLKYLVINTINTHLVCCRLYIIFLANGPYKLCIYIPC